MNTQEITAEFIAAYMDYLLADGRDGATLDEAARRLAKARAATDRVLGQRHSQGQKVPSGVISRRRRKRGYASSVTPRQFWQKHWYHRKSPSKPRRSR
jgi:hypothetical protein